MGQDAEDADIAGEMRSYRERFSRASARDDDYWAKRSHIVIDSKRHRPATDAEARELIERLDHYEWETHKVTGRFDRNPYTLTATIAGQHHTIYLPGRFGGVLQWLDAEERKRVEQ